MLGVRRCGLPERLERYYLGNLGKSSSHTSHPSVAPQCPVIHSFNKHSLSAYYVLGIVLEVMDGGK